ncbi:2-hydroxyacid dehydrogenase [Klugiella xanthotipulae]|uniref:Phosphoglycerate dehydrogenase-like enzyme n=1 Tax=Klugiella xanthotipulae TaxID=244735 RepID=A0A543HGW9_9MICO|nr:2-hydroxyacid dehydrogenase [Klugiella xanthotipulae]TQM57575.1 phosphoglycerate dehydrogenase-like enzyme [Klugiella xanthotipulae]
MARTPLTVSLPGNTLRDLLSPAPTGVELLLWDLKTPPPAAHIDIVVPPYMGTESVLGSLSAVTTQLVQSQSIGFDNVADALPPGHRFANASTVHEASTAELAVGLILAMQRGIPDAVRAADAGHWAPQRRASLADRTVLIVGFGGVGQAIEERLLPFETSVTRVARTARETPTGPIHPMSELPRLLPHADIVVLAMPLTAESTGMVNDAFLTAMADGALLVNVARGPIIDTDALVAHLHTGRLRAALDVTDPEPLPAEHPLWSCPEVLITPHVGGATSAMMPRMARLIRQQIELLQSGQEPVNVVIDGR